MKLVKEFDSPAEFNSIVLLCVIHNESLLIPSFLEHYHNLGVTHFVFIDNNSTDNSITLLSKCDLNVQIWSSNESYAKNDFGLKWVNQILQSHFKNLWCIVVDIDEFICIDNSLDLNSLRVEMSIQNSNVCEFVLIDFYPQNFKNRLSSEPFDPFFNSQFYDNFFNKKYYFKGDSPDDSFVLKGGVRQRLFFDDEANNDSVCLCKKSFFKYDFHNTHFLSVGMHWLLPIDFQDWSTYKDWDKQNSLIRYFKKVKLICHFKFVKPNITKYFEDRVNRNEDWDGSSEYKRYLNSMKDSFISKNCSERFTSISKLYKDTILYHE